MTPRDANDVESNSKMSHPASHTDHTSTTGNSNESKKVTLTLDSSILEMVTASGIDNEVEVDDDERESPLCCLCCCDMAKACIITNSMYLIFMIAGLILTLFGIDIKRPFLNVREQSDYITELQTMYDDDDYIEFQVMIKENEPPDFYLTILVSSAFAIIFMIIGILGAIKLNTPMILCTTIWFVIDLVMDILEMRWIAIVVIVLFLYPQIALLLAVYKGKLSKANYAREQHCCC